MSRIQKEYIGIDGELIDGEYRLLVAAFEKPQNVHYELFSDKQLYTEEILKFLCGIREINEANTIFAAYSFRFDTEMILQDLEPEDKEQIFQGNPVVWQNYKIEYIPNKQLRITQLDEDEEYIRSITINDLFGWYNQSFVKTIKEVLGIDDPLINTGKKNRGSYLNNNINEPLREYCLKECQYIAQLAKHQRELIQRAIGYTPRRLYGPSAIARQLLRHNKIRTFFPTYNEDKTPTGLMDAWKRAYFGGRVEQIVLGTANNLTEFDINSAYPYAMSLLPEISYRWKRVPGYAFEELSKLNDNQLTIPTVWRVRWDLSNKGTTNNFGPLPVRSRTGFITFPLKGQGWYWYPEVKNCLDWKNMEVLEGWIHQPTARHHSNPMEDMIFNLCNKDTSNDPKVRKTIKQIVNSMSGIFKQERGTKFFFCLPWAGMITSIIRARLFEFGCRLESNGQKVVAFNTDSIITLPPSNNSYKGVMGNYDPHFKQWHQIGKEIGNFKTKDWESGIFLMTGVYELRNAEETKQARKGYSNLDFDKITSELNKNFSATVNRKIFVTYNLSQSSFAKYDKDYLKFIDDTCVIDPAFLKKREYIRMPRNWKTSFTVSRPISPYGIEMSYPYRQQKEDLLMEIFSEDEI